MAKQLTIAILGAGSWGITLANYCHDLGHHVFLWEFDPQEADRMRIERQRELLLPGIRIHQDIQITAEILPAVVSVDIILLVVPSHIARSVVRQLAKMTLPEHTLIVNCAKGIENETQMRISEIVKQEMQAFDFNHYAVLSGPSHAEEVARGIPTAVVIASQSEMHASFLQHTLGSHTFRFYRSNDIAGVELGGALKNVIAIAAGICDGAGFGDNTKAALQPRGLAEIIRLGRKLGANPLTFAGLSGMGDLIVTCMSRHSRNRYLGEQIGLGRTLPEILKSMTMVAEGVRTCKSAVQMAAQHQVDMPICRQVYEILFEQKEPGQAMVDLMSREAKPEVWY
ncbi:NAD(P)-dependent glycerol-3-phosphate dehydrogenase [candidate division KSB1 bacterium]|nr:NAD(P)-dependent glycerol-3-phosphate dehydrogenase [candidate division KSB1 bacterium]